MGIESHRPQLEGISPREALPGLATALDEEAMKEHLQAALFGPGRARFTVERCTPTRPLYTPGESCLLRYRFRARSRAGGTVLKPIVMGRVFADSSTCAAYMDDRLAPLAGRMRGRPEVAAFAAPAAMIDALDMVVHVWPVDGELPTLVDATDRRRMLDVFREQLPNALGRPFVADDCAVELVSYRRRQRCVLRYTVTGKTPGGEPDRVIAYGKVTAFGGETLTGRTLEALHERIGEPAARHGFTLPRPLGSRPDLGLSLLEALAGEACIAPALAARLLGGRAADHRTLEEMVATGGSVAALLHGSGVQAGRSRTLDDELAGLRAQIAAARDFLPGFAERARSWLGRIAALGEQSQPLEPCLNHGDFKHEQLLFDGAASGLVDFDSICDAEPALDLGKFTAHLRAETRRIEGRASVRSALGEDLAERFVRSYVSAAGDRVEDEQRLRARTTLYEAVALLRLALRSQLDLDETRAAFVAALLDERLSAADELGAKTTPRKD